MNIPSAGALLVIAMIATAALGAVTTTVVDVPVAGATQRFLYVRPDAPVANIVALPGGDGVLGIQSDGTMSGSTACFPVGRNRQAFADGGYAVALVDANSLGIVRNFSDVLEVVRYVQARHNVPTWVIGGSSSTAAIANLGANLPGEIPGGVIFFSPDRPSASTVPLIKRPTLLVYHSADTLQFGAAMYNALTAAPVRERVVFTGGNNGGCGYHLFNGLDAEFVAAITGFIGRNNTFAAPAALNVQGLWWKAPAGSESGWGVNLTQQGEILFATWFTYDVDGRGMWLVMSAGARVAENTYSGALYRTTGPAFSATPFNSSQVGVTAVGTATFTFADSGNGTFAYVVNGVSQSKPITRQVYSTPEPTCAAGGPAGSTPNYQALWWSSPAGAESGWGVNVAHQGDIVFATWFTYDTSGRGMWLVMSNGAKTGPGAYSGTLYRTTGPAFSASPWLGTSVVASPVGTGAFAFSDANSGTFTYTLDGVTQAKPITRQEFASPVTVCR